MSDLIALAGTLINGDSLRTQTAPKRVRVQFGGSWVADSLTPTFVWEHKYFPQYYFRKDEVKNVSWGKEILEGKACIGAIEVDGKTSNRVVLFKEGPLNGLVRIEFAAMDQWFEEEQPIYVHVRSPEVRVDTLRSSRHVLVKIDGVTIAETTNSIVLFETLMPTRYYVPKTSVVDWKLFSPSETKSYCPYKGDALYYDVTVNGEVHKDVVWWHRYPTPECPAIAGSLCFYNEKLDIWIDGVKEEKAT